MGSIILVPIILITLFGFGTKDTSLVNLKLEEIGNSFVLENAKLFQMKTDVWNNSDLISLLDNRKKIVFIYDMQKKEFVDSFDVGLSEKQYLFNYEILDTNHILIALNPTYKLDQHDSVICIIG